MSRRNHRPQKSKRTRAMAQAAPPTTPKGSYRANVAANLADIAKVKVEGRCPTGKLRYPTEEEAAKALVLAKKKRDRAGQAHVEKRFYGGPKDPCTRGCGGYHLTSREAFQR